MIGGYTLNANALRHFYDYHFAENRKLWDYVKQLTPTQFAAPVAYSHGSVRDQLYHLIHVDAIWLSDLRGAPFPEPLARENLTDYDAIRRHWDAVEQDMRAYLATVTDDMLDTKPLSGEDADLRLWQILLHVANHGTDHRAQILRLLNDHGVKTIYQDYIFFAYGNMVDA